MRMATLALLGSIGLAVSAVSASAAPAVPAIDTQQASNIVQVAGGCGRWAHPNRWGHCVSNGYGYWSCGSGQTETCYGGWTPLRGMIFNGSPYWLYMNGTEFYNTGCP